MKTSFHQLIETNCQEIVKTVLTGMQMRKVGAKGATRIPALPILYKWWFAENSQVMQAIRDSSNHDEALTALLQQVETRTIDGKKYYALYFGKSNNGANRFRQHSAGNVKTSTLRQTIYGLCMGTHYAPEKEAQVTAILNECYYEWYEFEQEGELVECIESICIAYGKYPLNIDGNPAISAPWRKYVTERRKLIINNSK